MCVEPGCGAPGTPPGQTLDTITTVPALYVAELMARAAVIEAVRLRGSATLRYGGWGMTVAYFLGAALCGRAAKAKPPGPAPPVCPDGAEERS